jgi:hypothetical protein
MCCRRADNQAITELLHLWHSRRCAVRLKAELTAAVYDKALRRKDASGIVAEKEEEEKDDDKKDGKDKGKKEDKKEKKTNADSGKIVNLMAGECDGLMSIVAAATLKNIGRYGRIRRLDALSIALAK